MNEVYVPRVFLSFFLYNEEFLDSIIRDYHPRTYDGPNEETRRAALEAAERFCRESPLVHQIRRPEHNHVRYRKRRCPICLTQHRVVVEEAAVLPDGRMAWSFRRGSEVWWAGRGHHANYHRTPPETPANKTRINPPAKPAQHRRQYD